MIKNQLYDNPDVLYILNYCGAVLKKRKKSWPTSTYYDFVRLCVELLSTYPDMLKQFTEVKLLQADRYWHFFSQKQRQPPTEMLLERLIIWREVRKLCSEIKFNQITTINQKSLLQSS